MCSYRNCQFHSVSSNFSFFSSSFIAHDRMPLLGKYFKGRSRQPQKEGEGGSVAAPQEEGAESIRERMIREDMKQMALYEEQQMKLHDVQRQRLKVCSSFPSVRFYFQFLIACMLYLAEIAIGRS